MMGPFYPLLPRSSSTPSSCAWSCVAALCAGSVSDLSQSC